MFCFLPLPINTGLPFHVNGCFSVSEDRQRLVLLNDDDKNSGSKCSAHSWNTYLLQYPLVQALLRHIKKTNRFCETNKEAYRLWPRTFKSDVEPFVKSFYIAVVDKINKLFSYNGQSLPFSEILILEENNFIGCFQEMFDFLVNVPIDRDKKVLDVPDFVCNHLRLYHNDKTAIVGSAFISKSKALIHFLSNISDPYWTDKQIVRNKILTYAILEADEMVKQCFKTLPCIPTEPFGKLRPVLDLIHPDPKLSLLSKLFSELDERFILKYERLNEPHIYSKLVEFGMNDCTFPTELVYERCESLKSLARKCVVCTRNRMQCILEYLAQSNISPEMFTQLRYYNILPILNKPAGWIYPWKGESLQNKIVCKNDVKCLEHANVNHPHLILCQPESLYIMQCRNCVGSVCDILDETDNINPALLKHLGVRGRHDVSIPMLMEQLNAVGTDFEACKGRFTEETQQIIDDVYNTLDGLTIDVSKDEFQSIIADNFSWIASKPIVQVGDILVNVDRVAKCSVRSCPPYLYGLPKVPVSRWRILEKLGVKKCFCVTDIVRVLEIKAEENIQRPLLNIKEMINILEILVECMLREKTSYEDIQQFKECIIAPDRDGVFLPTYQLALEDDTMATKTKLKLLHDEISPSIGNAIGVRTKRQQLISQNTMAIPFGQREELTTRLKGLLKDYPTDESIMKELIQNADDAGAHEIHFIKYFEQRKVASSLEHGEHLQPALCIYNDSCFTDQDFAGIQNIGIGSKAEDEYKTGQFGVGFNAIYHITDSPSFLTKEKAAVGNGKFCMFDPLFKHIDTKMSNGESGIMYEEHKLKDDFPDTVTGFPTMPRTYGTMFRFPLRQVESTISDFCLAPSDVDFMLSSFKNAMPSCLHFLRHITKIKIRSFANGVYIDEYEVESEILSKEERKKQTNFLTQVKENVESAKTHQDILEVMPINAIYKMRIHDTEGHDTTWLIVHQFGANMSDKTRLEQMQTVFKSGKLRLLPTGGVSLKLCAGNVKDFLQSSFLPKLIKKDLAKGENTYHKTQNDSDGLKWQICDGKSYCFLPLPEETGLPFNVHGNFSLDRARRGLWDEGYRMQWNKFLLSSVVTEALIEALKFLQKYWIEENLDLIASKFMLKNCLNIYFSHFPSHEATTNTYWKFFVENFNRSVIQNHTSLFPIVSDVFPKHTKADGDRKCCFKIEWIHLATDLQSNDGGVVDTLREFGDRKEKKKQHIKGALRSLSIKLTSTNLDLVQTMEKSGHCSVIKTEPLFVMNVIKSRLQNVNCFVKDTVMKDTVVVKSILEYVKHHKHFSEEIECLPLCVTNDNYLRTFNKDGGVYCSKYCSLLPRSFERFVHYDLVYLLEGKELFESRILSPFTFQNFVEMLPCSYDPMLFRIGSNVKWEYNENKPVDRKIISMLWKFMFEDSKTERQQEDKRLSADIFKDNVNSISDWSFLPSRYKVHDQILHELIPIERTYTLLSEECVSDLGPILEQVNIPTLDINVFEQDEFNSAFINALKGLTSSTYNADELLRCIHYHKDKLESCNLSSDGAFTLLRVFDQHISLLDRKLGSRAKKLLRELPLYETMQSSSFVNIAEAANVVVSSSTVPSDGLDEWARNHAKVIVKENMQLKCLYKYIELPQNSDLDMYSLHIFPSIAHMPRNYWLTHIEFVKDNLLCKRIGTEFSEKQNQLIDMMKKLPFIDIGCVSYCANQLHDKTHPVFKTILGETQFLPDKYMDSSWKCFMEIIGLTIRPTGSMLIEYARNIAREGDIGVTDDLIYASDVIVSCLFGDFDERFDEMFDEDVFNNIKDIKFVVPYSVPSEMSKLFPGKCSNNVLISFSGSCISKFANVCWTSLPLVKRDPSEKIMEMLDIARKPSVDAVISHCQNICGVFSDDFTSEQNKFKDKVNYMEYVYIYLQENRNEMMRQRLQETPFILIPGDTMIKASNVFLTAPESSELKPYLYKVPFELQRYIELFKCIGATNEPTCSQYANVLNSIKSQCGDQELPSNILALVSKAISNFFEIICIEDNNRRRNVEEVTCLYLPNEFRILEKSSELTIADNDMYRVELENKCRLNLFMGFNKLDINLDITSEPFKKLPDRLKPQFLSDEVSQIISTQGMVEVFSNDAEYAEQFIRSTEFFEGVCRLLRHQNTTKSINNSWSKENEVVLQHTLLSVRIKEVLGLRTCLCYKGHVVKGVSLESEFYVDKIRVETDLDTTYCMYCLYYQADNASSSMGKYGSLQSGLISLLDICTDDKLSKQSVLLLQQMLDVVPYEIGRFLDRNKIPGLEHWKGNMAHAFPSPGTYVEKKFHPFMLQMIAPFKQHEYIYVAVEIEIDESDEIQSESQPRYIYGHIEQVLESDKSSQLNLRYYVNLGFNRGGTIVVPIFRIFKFLPKTTGTSEEVVEDDSEPERIMDTLKEAFENFSIMDRKRIIRRMLLQWHPDKNPDHEEYSKRIFYFIQNCTLRLERGEQLIIQSEPDMPDMRASRYWHTCVNATNTGKLYTKGYQDTINEYNKSSRHEPLGNLQSDIAPVHSPGEYKRWLRQAELDFDTGESQMICAEKHPETFNWICYICHQACEKALKAAWFLRDARKCPQRAHSLEYIAFGLDDDIAKEALEFETRLDIRGRDNFKLRYPDSVGKCKIPSEVFSKGDAEFAVATTKKILDMVLRLKLIV